MTLDDVAVELWCPCGNRCLSIPRALVAVIPPDAYLVVPACPECGERVGKVPASERG